MLPDQLLFERSTTENYALDSFQNLLFSIARFHEFTGHFPSAITIVGYEFKRPRFTDLHREALRWPIDKFNYVGVDPKDGHREDAVQGEVGTPLTVLIYIKNLIMLFHNSKRTDIFPTPMTSMDAIPCF